MDGFLSRAEQDTQGIVRSAGKYRDVPFVHLTTPDRSVHVYSAYPSEKLHLRSNSKVAFERILDTISGGNEHRAKSLGSTDEYAYIRTLMPYGAEEEDGLIYLSDPFIRHMVGPQLKLTERRRRICNNHLRMIGHAAALFQTEHGKPPSTLEELAEANCSPGTFGEGRLTCPCGGEYSLAADGLTGVCSHHGTAKFMIPCCEIPLSQVSADEAQAYRRFVEEYSRYWRTFFDPIAVRVQVTPQRYRLETIVLPLIDNSLYTGLALALGGEPEHIDLAPIPDRTIFSACVKIDKEGLLQRVGWMPPEEETDAKKSMANFRQTAHQLRRFGLAMHNYHDVYNRFPAIANFDQAERPLLSWRVHLLPYLGAQALYDRFRHDEPWDSPHNKTLIEQMPDVFKTPGRKPAKPGMTSFVVAVGPDTLFTGRDQPQRISHILDGTSNTIMVMHTSEKHTVVWTKPDDIAFDIPKIRRVMFEDPGRAVVCFADGSVRQLPDTLDDQTLRALFTRRGSEVVQQVGEPIPSRQRRMLGLDELLLDPITEWDLYEFVTRGLSNKASMHVYDADPLFDFQLIGFLGQAVGDFAGRRGIGFDDDLIPFVFLGASLNAPVYVSVPLEDPEVADAFLEKMDQAIARIVRLPQGGGFFEFNGDFYQLPLENGLQARSAGIQLGPIKWRFFWARIGDSIYVASKPFILEDLAAKMARLEDEEAAVSDLKAHAMIRIRPQHWNQVLPAYRLGWAERHRLACLDNVGRLSSLSRLQAAAAGESVAARSGQPAQLETLAEDVYGVSFFCPEGGQYVYDDMSVRCSVHGSAEHPQQSAVPDDNVAIDSMLRNFSGLTVALTFLEDGLHAVLLIERD
jgi:hypothetical protein